MCSNKNNTNAADKEITAVNNHNKQYNCTQSVLCSFADELDMDEALLFSMAEGFGLGMGGMEGTCGALSGAVLAAGLANSDGNIDDPATKAKTYKLSKELTKRFDEASGALICKELKGIGKSAPLCSCENCIKNAARITQEILFEK